MNIEELYREYFTPVYRYILSLSRNPEIAEEVTQETFFRALKKIDTYRGEASIHAWLCRIAKNLWIDMSKKKSRSVPLDESQCEDDKAYMNSEIAFSPEEQLLQKQTAMLVYKVLHELKEPYKEVFQLRTFGDLSFSEIAELFSKSESWARVTYYRARMMIREELSDEDTL